VSEKIQVTVDPELSYAGKKIMSGDYLRAVLSPELSEVYSREGTQYVSKEELWQGMDYVKSVRAEWIDSAHPEPAQNASTGRGELGGAVYLHSGEFALSEVDLRIPGRGLDFELRRTYESQSIYSGPFGWNWDHNYNRRLQELPDGSLAYFDGAGRRDVFRAVTNEEGTVLRYEPPGGRFVETYRRLDGSVTMRDEKGVIQVFNGLGRLTRLMDRNGNSLEFAYDLSGKLSTAMDTMGRLIQFEYYPYVEGDVRSGRLQSVGDFSGRKVNYSYDAAGDLVSANFEGLLTQYAYTTGSDLKSGHNLTEVVDPKGQKAIENFYDSSDEVSGQKVGGVSISVNAGLSATTTDGNGHMRSYMHDEKGRPVSETEGGYATSYAYNTDGLITSMTSPMGNTVSYTYDSANPGRTSQANLLQVTEMPGSGGGPTLTTIFTYDLSSNQMTSMTDPKGNMTEYMLDAAGNVVAVKSPGNIVNSYQHNQYGQLIGEANPVGAVTEYAYYPESAPGGRSATLGGRSLDPQTGGYLMAAVQDTGGEAIASRYEYDERGALLLEARGEDATEYEVDRFGQVTVMKEGAQSAAGQPAMNLETAYTYDANGNVTTKSSRGVTSVYSYDSRNLMTSVDQTAGAETQGFSFAYDGAGNVIAATYPKGNQDTFAYDNRNLLVSKTEGGLTTVHYTYDGNGNRKTVVDGAGKTSTYVYDGHDRLLGVTDPLGNQVSSTLDANGNATEVRAQGADGAATAAGYQYDALDRMTQQTIGTSTSVYGYDPASRLVSTQTPNGGVWALPRTGTGRVRQMTDPAGNTDDMSWTPGGNLAGVVEREAGGRTLGRSFSRDVLGKVLKEGDTVGRDQRYTYDADGRLDGTSDPENNQTTFTYDGFGRVKEEIRHLGTGGEAKTSFAYDANGNLVSAQDANGNTTSYEYDAKNRLTKITYPDATFETYAYDGNDRVEVQKDQNGTVVTNRYDDSGRLIRREAQKAAGIEGPAFEAFGYDGLGRLIRAESGDTVAEFTYDEQGRIIAEKQNGKTVGSGYDADGNKTSLAYPSGKTVGLAYDSLDRIQTIAKEAPVASYTYEGKAKVTGKTAGPVRMEAAYDDGRRPTALSWKNAAENRELVARLMGWNKTDLKTSETRVDENSKVEQYEYDALSRLKKVTAPEKEVSYVMDGVENITRIDEREKDVNKIVELQVNSRNQIVSRNGVPLTYDASGNLIHYVHNYIYDWKNQLVRVEKADGSEVRFTYDALGRRIGKEYIAGSNQAATRYVYDGWRVIEQRDDTDALKTRYTYGNGIDEAVEVEKDRDNDGVLESYYPVLNNIGSVVGIADAEGKLVEKIDYATYGTPTFIYDHASPEVDVVRVKEGAILIRFSEPVKKDKAQQAIKIKKGTEELSGAITFEDEDRAAKFTVASSLPQNETLTASISTDLEDLAQNKLAQKFSQTFTFAGTDLIAYDRTSPEVESIRLVSGVIYVEFSEEIDPATIAGAVELSSAVGPAAGEVSPSNERTVKFTPTSTITPRIEYTVRVKTAVRDLSGKSLASETAKAFNTSGSDLIIYQKPDPNHQIASYIGNTTLFQGREFDQETGLYYFRARYLNPELGRFLQPDPKGYVDSFNTYQSLRNNPINFSDPYGNQALHGMSEQGLVSAYVQLRRQGFSDDEALECLEKYGYIGPDIVFKLSLIITAKSKPFVKVMEPAVYHGSGFVPVVGEAQDFLALTTGYDPITSEQLTISERAISGVTLFIPVVAGTHIRKAMKLFRKAPQADDVARLAMKEARQIKSNKWLLLRQKGLPKRIVIGENMERVRAAAKKLGAETFEGTGMETNRAWIQMKKAQGYEIYDIGPDFVRRSERVEEGIRPDSPFYNMERKETSGYKKYFKVFERIGKYKGGTSVIE